MYRYYQGATDTLPIQVFPDMEPDPDIVAWRSNAHLRTLFRPVDDIVSMLLDCAKDPTVTIYRPPTMAQIAEEVEVLMPALCCPSDRAPVASPARAGSGAFQEILRSIREIPGDPHFHFHFHFHVGDR